MGLLVQLSVVFFTITFAVCQACDPSEMVKRHEGMKQCMYLDSRKIRTTGIGFNLESSGARQAVESVGANYEKIIKGPATPVRVPCDCSHVICLNQTQVSGLFKISLQRALQDASGILPSLLSMCCGVQNAVIDMTFNLGKSKLSVFTDFLKFLKLENWKAAADDLLLTKYCNDRDTKSRCTELAGYIRIGCPCFGSYPKRCASTSVCCGSNAKCCQYTQHFSGYIKKDLPETGCCPFSDGVCCEPNPWCCPSDYPVCGPDKRCYQKDGAKWIQSVKKVPATKFLN